MLVFNLGRIIISKAVNSSNVEFTELMKLVQRHVNGDWQHMEQNEVVSNKSNIAIKEKIFSTFITKNITVCIVTHSKHEQTDISLQSELSSLDN